MKKFTYLVLFVALLAFSANAQETKTLGTGGDFTTMQAAINYINGLATLPAGGVVLNVTAGQTFSEESLPAITINATADKPIVIKKSGTGNNPIISVAGGTGITDYGLKVAGADYVTIDGIDITTTAAVEYALWVTISPTMANPTLSSDGAQHNTFKNMNITSAPGNTGTLSANWGVLQAVDIDLKIKPSDVSGTNSSNTYDAIVVDGTFCGLFFRGHDYNAGDAVIQDQANVVKGCTFKNLGKDDVATRSIGILTESQANFLITRNTIDNVITLKQIVGIYPAERSVDGEISYNTISNLNTISTNYCVGIRSYDIERVKINGNKIFNITSEDDGLAAGMELRAANEMIITNNMIWGIKAMYMAIGGHYQWVIGAEGIALFWVSGAKVYYNTVLLEGANDDAGSSAALNMFGSDKLDVRNNIFANKTTKGFAPAMVLKSDPTESWTPFLATSDNNYYLSAKNTEVINQVGALVSTGYAPTDNDYTFAEYKTAVGALTEPFDQNSITGGTIEFVAADNLHIKTTVASVNDNVGKPIDGYTTDIDGEARHATTPDIGADEFTFGVSSIKDVANTEALSAYPNPTSEMLNIEVANFKAGSRVQIFSTLGQMMYNDELINAKVQINMSQFANGLYVVKVINGNEIQIAKVLKK